MSESRFAQITNSRGSSSEGDSVGMEGNFPRQNESQFPIQPPEHVQTLQNPPDVQTIERECFLSMKEIFDQFVINLKQEQFVAQVVAALAEPLLKNFCNTKPTLLLGLSRHILVNFVRNGIGVDVRFSIICAMHVVGMITSSKINQASLRLNKGPKQFQSGNQGRGKGNLKTSTRNPELQFEFIIPRREMMRSLSRLLHKNQ
ncbi:hypothetical protein GQ457_04G019240 [Hibiscus cannabinus]